VRSVHPFFVKLPALPQAGFAVRRQATRWRHSNRSKRA
jgi:hypothetical protein